MEANFKKQLEEIACKVRIGIIEGVHAAKAGHPGGSLSIAEILTYLYFKEMNIDPKDPKNPKRDRFVLSKGHAAPALYATLALRGFFPVDELILYRHWFLVLSFLAELKPFRSFGFFYSDRKHPPIASTCRCAFIISSSVPFQLSISSLTK